MQFFNIYRKREAATTTNEKMLIMIEHFDEWHTFEKCCRISFFVVAATDFDAVCEKFGKDFIIVWDISNIQQVYLEKDGYI